VDPLRRTGHQDRHPLDALRDTVAQLPTFSEAFVNGLEALEA
jgi:hypothetical protein